MSKHRPHHNLHQITLADLKTGQTGTFIESTGGRHMAGRLISMGFTPGVQVQVAQNYGHGPLLVTVRGSFVALGRGEARKILVQPRNV